MGWLTGWSYRKSHVISAATGAGTNYQVKITVHYGSGSDSNGDIYCNSHCRTDFGDIRFTDNDETTLLDCWMESKTNSNNAVFWVEVADSLESSNVTIYIYYGNATATYPYLATDLAQGEATFLFFDNFVDNTIDTAKWQTYGSGGGSISETGGEMVVTGAGGAIKGAYGKTSWQYGIAIRYRGKIASNSGNCFIGLDDFDGSTSHGYCSSYIYVGSVLRHYTNNGSSGGSTDIGGGGNYNLVDISYLSGQSKCWLNGTLVSTRTTTVPTIALPVNISGAGNYSVANVDWILVRKYVTTEPAHSTWGTEESGEIAKTKEITEVLGFADTLTESNSIFRSFTELLGLKDSWSRSKTIHRTVVTELLGLKDTKSYFKSLTKTLTELLGFKDIVSFVSTHGFPPIPPIPPPVVEALRGLKRKLWIDKILGWLVQSYNPHVRGDVERPFGETTVTYADIEIYWQQTTTTVIARIADVFAETMPITAPVLQEFTETIRTKGDIETVFSETLHISSDVMKAVYIDGELKVKAKVTLIMDKLRELKRKLEEF